jgi:hypothetical protein
MMQLRKLEHQLLIDEYPYVIILIKIVKLNTENNINMQLYYCTFILYTKFQIFIRNIKVEIFSILFKNFGIELFFREMSLQVFSPIYNVSQLSSKWISVVPPIH